MSVIHIYSINSISSFDPNFNLKLDLDAASRRQKKQKTRPELIARCTRGFPGLRKKDAVANSRKRKADGADSPRKRNAKEVPSIDTIFGTWNPLPSDAFPEIAKYLDQLGLVLHVSRSWNKEFENCYPAILEQYQSNALVSRFIPPLVAGADAKSRVLETRRAIEKVLKQSGLSMQPGMRASLLEQAIKDRDLILFFKEVFSRVDLSLEGTADQQASQIRKWMVLDENRRWINTISYVYLRELGLFTIPKEIEYFSHMNHLDLGLNQINDLSPLCPLESLEVLLVFKNQIKTLPALPTTIIFIYLTENQVSDLAPLGSLHNLRSLFLSKNQIKDLTALGLLQNLGSIVLSENQISDIAALGSLGNLYYLNLVGNPINASREEILVSLHEDVRSEIRLQV